MCLALEVKVPPAPLPQPPHCVCHSSICSTSPCLLGTTVWPIPPSLQEHAASLALHLAYRKEEGLAGRGCWNWVYSACPGWPSLLAWLGGRLCHSQAPSPRVAIASFSRAPEHGWSLREPSKSMHVTLASRVSWMLIA